MLYLPNGSVVAIASTYDALDDISAITNASEAVATLEASHGVLQGDIVEITSGWAKLNGRIARAKTVSTNDVTLEGINTTSTTNYPAGSGVGSVRVVSAWTQISQILESTAAGGEQQFYNYQFLEDTDSERQIPTIRSARSLQFTVADDATLPHYAILDAADQDRIPRALRLTMPSGAVVFYNGYVSFNKTPTLTKNEAMALVVTLSLSAEPTRY